MKRGEYVGNSSDISGKVASQSYMAEMHNDGLYFLEQAKKATDEFLKRRFLRASIIYFCTSVEAAMCRIVSDKLVQIEHELEQGDEYIELKNSLNDPNGTPPRFFRSIDGKIKVVEDIFGSKIPLSIKRPYKQLTFLRNKIIHYSNSYKSQIYATGKVEKLAYGAPDVVDKFLSILFGYINLSDGYYKNRTSRY
ncbi:hypothetical protein DCC85_14425 [Paenibacillus sp. CAA11]|uniref:hypothetical protein n=1 Tax=Paenibacillus sp. CAA11 TaxID=1532905 RepID=UPI000D3BD125|nr:hypothetical protein [Paenibacillus sp. CAA11]AWB45304.1 hypothetical protein DCC85_14425 [Paenibacillus sp. CAA11]